MPDPPESLGDSFVDAVRNKKKKHFQHLLRETGYLWGLYFKRLTPEEQKWAVANRPIGDGETTQH